MTSPTAQLIIPSGQRALPRLVTATGRASAAPGAGANLFGFQSVPHQLSLLLAGPILRYANAQEVMVWVAMSKPMRVAGKVLDPHLDQHGSPSGSATELGRGAQNPTRLGANLYVALVAIRPTGSQAAFPTGRVLVYDLVFHAPDGMVFDTAGGFVAAGDVSYGAPHLPAFLLGAPSEQVFRAVHGSCRKMGGTGRDAALELEAHVRRYWNDAGERPRALLLTGDQIYADDVPGDMKRAIIRASELLLGFREWLPGQNRHTEGVNDRAPFVRDHGLTVDAEVAHHHLIGFGEFAAMYLFAWSPQLWDDTLLEPHLRGARQRNYNDARRMRRVMANIPTYMVIDDHEITDDWPMDQIQVNAVTGNATGRWIIANGLAAAWFFQVEGNGRGNAPFLPQFTEYIDRGVQLTRQFSATGLQRFHQVSDHYARNTIGVRNTGFVAPTHPPVILLDTRTQRELPRRGSPGLLDAAGRSWLRSQFRRLPADTRVPLLIVSPAPVLANEAYDRAQSLLSGIDDRYVADRESWSHHPRAFRDFLRILAEAGRKVVVFSGDVHFGYTASGRFAHGSRGAGLEIVQLTSSGMKNRPSTSKLAGLLAGTPSSPVHHSFPSEPRNLVTTLHHVIGQDSVFARNNIGIVTVDWSGAGFMVIHGLEGEGQRGGSRVVL